MDVYSFFIFLCLFGRLRCEDENEDSSIQIDSNNWPKRNLNLEQSQDDENNSSKNGKKRKTGIIFESPTKFFRRLLPGLTNDTVLVENTYKINKKKDKNRNLKDHNANVNAQVTTTTTITSTTPTPPPLPCDKIAPDGTYACRDQNATNPNTEGIVSDQNLSSRRSFWPYQFYQNFQRSYMYPWGFQNYQNPNMYFPSLYQQSASAPQQIVNIHKPTEIYDLRKTQVATQTRPVIVKTKDEKAKTTDENENLNIRQILDDDMPKMNNNDNEKSNYNNYPLAGNLNK